MASSAGRVRFSLAEDNLTIDPPSPPADDQTKSLTTPRFYSRKLGGNLMRELKDRDPLFYYEVVSVLGVGSMGSVAKVRKRQETVGGSARKELQEYFKREKRLNKCFQIPVLGHLFRQCLGGDVDLSASSRSALMTFGSDHSERSSVTFRQAPVEDYNDGHGESSTKQMYAMKSIHLSRVADKSFIEELKNEIAILRSLDHPHIVRPIETFEHRNQIFIVMELCTGGDLYARDPYTEEEAARIVSSILSAIAYMHSRSLIHRDLKFENIIFANNSPRAEVKLIDFGLSQVFGKDEMTEGVGTIYTMAPEVLKGSYTKQADLWSIGVIAYMLLSSQMPFYGRKRQHIVEQIMKGAYEFKGRRWKRVSPQAKDFVESLLQVDPEERHSADEALGHVWLNRRHAATVRNPMQHEEESAHESLLKFANYSKLKKVALMVIAHKSTSEEIGILRKVFQKYDTKKDGVLSYEEFKAGFEAAGLAEDDCRKIFDACDLDGSGKIRYTEFLAATIEAHGAITEEKLAEAFDRLDSDDSGFISAANLREILGDEITDEQIDAIIKEADLTKDGKISYTEFLALWEDQHENFRESVFQDLAVIDAATDVSASFDSVDPTEIKADTDEIVSRANFIEQKKEAVRRFSGEFKDMSSEVFLDGDLALAAAAAASQANDGGNGLSPPAFSADV